MSVRYKVNCRVCQMSRGDAKFRHRIYQAWFNPTDGDTSPTALAKELSISPTSMLNHCKKHLRSNLGPNESRLTKHIARVQAKVYKAEELAIDHPDIVPKQDFEQVIDGVLSEGLQQMLSEGKKISISQLLTAAKIKADYTGKRRGQDTELIKTMYRMAGNGQGAGNGTRGSNGTTTSRVTKDGPEDGGTVPTGGMDNPGEVRPDSIHNASARYAAARGAKEVSNGDIEAQDQDQYPDLRQQMGQIEPLELPTSVVSIL